MIAGRCPLSAAVLVCIISVTLAACTPGASTASPGSPSASPASASASPAGASASPGSAQNAVTISNFAFSPAAISVPVGTKVTWTNQDSTEHTITADDGKTFDSGRIANGATFSFTFMTAGTFAYHCSIHTSMKATVVVTP